MSNDFPQYTDAQLNALKVMILHSKAMSESWESYAKAANKVLEIHELLKETPHLRSLELAYQGALINLEAAKVRVQEFKDIAYKAGIIEWLP